MRTVAVAFPLALTLLSAGAAGQEEPPAAPAPRQGSLLRERAQGRKVLVRASAPAADAVAFALGFLAGCQADDGRWDADGFLGDDTDGAGPGAAAVDVGVTGLALLALLGEHDRIDHNPHRDAITRGVAWLVRQQGKDGVVGPSAHPTYVYDHAIATLALVEAHATGVDAGTAAQAAIDALEAHRNPYAVWRYGRRSGDNDSSVTAWAALAMLVARDTDLTVPPAAIDAIEQWYAHMTDPDTGRCGYAQRGGWSSRNPATAEMFPVENGEAMTAVALAVRTLIGKVEAADLAVSEQVLLACPPQWKEGAVDPYYWCFGALALALRGGDEPSTTWRKGLIDAAVHHQRRERALLGSFDPQGPWGSQGGRVYSTAMMTIALQAPYRYRR